MPSAIPGFTPTTPPGAGQPKSLNQMTSSDFLNLMITQMQQQDPLNPSSSDQLLNQMSQIKQLQTSSDLNTTLSGLSLQQSISSAGGMIGQTVQGLDSTGAKITGVVTGVSVQNEVASLSINTGAKTNSSLPLSSLTAVGSAVDTTTPAPTP